MHKLFSLFSRVLGRLGTWLRHLWVPLKTMKEIRREVPEERFIKLSGRWMHMEQAGTGDAVILLHGILASTYTWRNVVPGLSRTHRVIAFDLLGHGYSERPKKTYGYGIAEQGRLVLRLLERFGLEKAHFIGHSLGSSVAFWIATHHPEKVRSIVLVNGPPTVWSNYYVFLLKWLGPLIYLLLRTWFLRPRQYQNRLRRNVFEKNTISRKISEGYRARLCIEGLRNALRGLAVELSFSNAWEHIDKLNIPARFVLGEKDPLMSNRFLKKLAEARSDVDIINISNCGHMIVEEKPEALLRHVLEFLERQNVAVTAPQASKAASSPPL